MKFETVMAVFETMNNCGCFLNLSKTIACL